MAKRKLKADPPVKEINVHASATKLEEVDFLRLRLQLQEIRNVELQFAQLQADHRQRTEALESMKVAVATKYAVGTRDQINLDTGAIHRPPATPAAQAKSKRAPKDATAAEAPATNSVTAPATAEPAAEALQ